MGMPPSGPFHHQMLGTLDPTTSLIVGVASGTSVPKNCRGVTDLVLYMTSSAALSAGTVIVEEATWDDLTEKIYSGTWSQIASYTMSSVFASAGGQSGQHLPVSAYSHVRVRIGTTLVGGLLSAVLEGC